ncbi:tail fiber assembly protein [Chromobacterium piscinae]|uniref:Tail fiber assembly protein n=2 Tax=Chromobacterium piscinae TaxID=686831 RepID=A0ABV0H8R3_9NEIS
MQDNKTVYDYHPQTGEYQGPIAASPSPLEPGIWLLPAHSTELQPPVAAERQTAVFRDGGWTVTPDWRAVKLWSVDTALPVQARLGDTPESLRATLLQPCDFPVWDGKSWAINKTAQSAALAQKTSAELKQRLADAYAARRPLEDAESIGIATADELQKLAAWKRYCVDLSRLPDLAMWPRLVDADWPKQPA